MAITSFEELARGVCELAGCATPEISAGDNGAEGVGLRVDGVEVALGYDPSRAAGCAIALLRFGPLPQEHEAGASAALLRANTLIFGAHAPQFGLDPATGDVLLQQVFPLDETSPVELYQSIMALARTAREWRAARFDHGFADERPSPGAGFV